MYKIKRFWGKICKIFEYIPLLWQDEDWDYEFLLVLIKFKLQRIKKNIVKNHIIANEEIRKVCIGINQTIDHIDNYLNPFSYEDINDFEHLSDEIDYVKKYEFEQNEWNLIFDTIKKEGQGWWD